MMISLARRVIIVDDHDVIRRGLRRLVEETSRYQVVGEAANGRSGLDLAKSTQPDIAILDYSVPELNGLDLSFALKKVSPHTEILLFTIQDCAEILPDVLRAGIRGYVLKSDDEGHVVAALDALSVHRTYFSSAPPDILLKATVDLKSGKLAKSLRPVILSKRERQVIQLVVEGRSSKEIGDRLRISVKTVESHRAKARWKLKARTTADLVRYAIRTQLIVA